MVVLLLASCCIVHVLFMGYLEGQINSYNNSVHTLCLASCCVAVSKLPLCMESEVTSLLDICNSHFSTS